MILLLTLLNCLTLAHADETAPASSSHQLEINETVIEGANKGFSGVTTVRTKNQSTSLYSRQIDFKRKIKSSIQDSPNRIISSDAPSGGKQ